MFWRENSPPRYTLFPIPPNMDFSDKKSKTHTWNKFKLYCKAQVNNCNDRTENLPLLKKRRDELIECN